MSMITTLAKNAATAAKTIIRLSEQQKNVILLEMAAKLRSNFSVILEANKQDMQAAKEDGLDDAMLDRLLLDEARINAMAEGIEVVASLPNPVGQTRDITTRPNGIKISKMRIPLGVVCMIYEARPNVTADAGALCFKSGNAVILRGGKEALHSSKAIAGAMQTVLKAHNLPEAIITVVPDPDRALMLELIKQKEYIDVIIPRGGEGLINFVTQNSLIPVIQHYKGVCHLYVDKDANIDKAVALLLNGKTQRTGVCNALEGLLVHKDIAANFLPLASAALAKENVKINSCQRAAQYFDSPTVLADTEFGHEYLGLEIAVRIVDDIEGAISHIDTFGSNHTEVICTEDKPASQLFQQCVDASVVMVNASSRFSDGSQLGLGAEIGIATTKMHAYGPMGLESLTAEKFLVNGDGQVRA
ncbi:glutamate-5-semialdehyde dehydrogenase [Glaciecola punicea ACAM 611]|uniref:Gamma-glutamyl phosphate reductase n=1 Tax=Glaciecola punicea ACAM 611 TaxID=1121923 RepID=H5TA92_9ALTE|nr:glutamate-5-semialdehyde dehydrogenase [Glaciecola punicea]GAB55219.1 glutamate-5-semialdehyde dehydrogenase [Glaciecola punicea ACAM 611]